MNPFHHRFHPFHRVVVAALLACAGASVQTSAIAAFPDKPVRIVIPFAPGGGTDTWARMFAKRYSARLGQPVVVENKPGASMQIGTNAVAKADPDGYTLLFTSGTHIQIPALYPNVPYDTVKDFAPVGQLGTVGLMFVVNPSVNATNMREFIAQAKAAKGWSLGTYAAGSTGAVFGQYLGKSEGLDLPVVVYKGEAPAITDVVGGQVQGGFFSVPGVKGFLKAGRLKALAIMAAERSPSFPDVQTLVEQGMPRYQWPGIYLAMYAPAKTPKPVLDRLVADAKAVTEDPDFVREWTDADVVVRFKEPAEFAEESKRDMERWRDLVQTLGVKAE